VARRFREEKRYSLETEREKSRREVEAEQSNQSLPAPGPKRFGAPAPSLVYPSHSLPASPTMMDPRNLSGMIGLNLRHFARVGGEAEAKTGAPREAHENSRGLGEVEHRERDSGALDYRFTPGEQSPEVNGRSEQRALAERQNGEREEREEADYARRERLMFRPESAPTVLASAHAQQQSALAPLDMSPEASLSGPPGSAHDLSTDGMDERRSFEGMRHFHNLVQHRGQPVTSNQDLSDCVQKALNTSGGGGRYSCDECGKLFKHPGSLQHHRHIHRGTHKCPSCGKAFSRRWDMERHLNKSKYGCPANRFGGGGAEGGAEAELSPGGHTREVVLTSVSPMEVAVSSVSGGGVTSSMLSSLPHPLGTGHSDTAAMVTLLPSHINGTH